METETARQRSSLVGTGGKPREEGSECPVQSVRKVASEAAAAAAGGETEAAHNGQESFYVSLQEDLEPAALSDDSFPTAISIKLVMVRKKNGLPDSDLQEILREKMRILEHDSREVTTVFSELSARLLAIISDEDLIVITFRTVEEIWKFSTYYSLGLVNYCIENLFLERVLLLNHLDEDDAGITVQVDEEGLHLMYCGILQQEGTLFARFTGKLLQDLTDGEPHLKYNDVVIVDTPRTGSHWIVQSLSNASKAQVAKSSLEPLIPFSQVLFKNFAENLWICCSNDQFDFPYQAAAGFCLATSDYEANGPDELSFQTGDSFEIVGYLVSCLEWFVAKHEDTGQTGLVKTCHVAPCNSTYKPADVVLDEEQNSMLKLQGHKEANFITFLDKILETESSTVFKMDNLEGTQPSGMLCQKNGQVCSKNIELELQKTRSNYWYMELAKKRLCEDQHLGSSLSSQLLEQTSDQHFVIANTEEDSADEFQDLIMFLNSANYKDDYCNLYDFSCSFLSSLFSGYGTEEELVNYLGKARETARKTKKLWAQSRICFLLGKLCAKKCKFSQARVYFEEAISVAKGYFTDMFFLIAIYANLSVIYLKQKNKEKCSAIFERISALCFGVCNYICSTTMESEILKHILKKAILSENKFAEARACFLLAKHYISINQEDRALPFIERLQLLAENFSRHNSLPHSYFLNLGLIYHQKCLPNLSLSCFKQVSLHPSSKLTECLVAASLVVKNTPQQSNVGKDVWIPVQMISCLKRIISLAEKAGELKLVRAVRLCLSQLFQYYKLFNKAIHYLKQFTDSDFYNNSVLGIDNLLCLAWLHILNGQFEEASSILDELLQSPGVKKGTLQEGAIYNLHAIALKHIGNIKHAMDSYHKAQQICELLGSRQNHAVVQANLGFLCIAAKFMGLAELYLTKSVKLFSEQQNNIYEIHFIKVLLEVGLYYVGQNLKDKAKFFYEWALLIAIMGNHNESQLQATQLLCYFYKEVCPNEAQCIIYSEYLLLLAQKTGDKVLEGETLETISQLYFGLGTERAYRSSLEYTKRSLGIFIDLKKKEKEAFGWLQAGKIYYILRQNELVDLYIQVARDAGSSTGNVKFMLELYEAAGDVFFNGSWDRDRAITFYRDQALPLAIELKDLKAQMRLSNKIAELLLILKTFKEAVEFVQIALSISIKIGDHLNERVSYHRLASVYYLLDQFELTEHYYLKALSLCSSPLQFDEEALYYVKVYQILGDITFYKLKDPYDAAGYYHLALAAAMDLGNKRSQLKLCTRLATIYHNFVINRELSLFFYQKARVFATDLNIRRINLSPDHLFQTIANKQFRT
ncbi:LOW QUALITY PROTEIN: SH3 domain and tetratricopeptide repeat-containing protein 1 [Erpetoichthys calabaricus]|uniref:LOW QUALITY PROTEIN: SH3 domain and tetratricopeptide repeat-containing protein 1 n=1 Tax=Erpetoichthys calabaricus TaxID=27687 RepID=UPI002234D3B9|nr:LOW QUALITY PROTEIN: SH3 domain and tetratricopeptide repeat-containing protein 1 [Erpetoichthys calabaricus]